MTEGTSSAKMHGGLAAYSSLWHSCKIYHDEQLTCSH